MDASPVRNLKLMAAVNSDLWPGPRKITLERKTQGFGFTLRHFIVYPPESATFTSAAAAVTSTTSSLTSEPAEEDHPVDTQPAAAGGRKRRRKLVTLEPMDTIFVKQVKEGGPADLAGLNKGDRIISINSESVTGKTYNQVVELVQSCDSTLQLLVMPRDEDILQVAYPGLTSSPSSPTPKSDHLPEDPFVGEPSASGQSASASQPLPPSTSTQQNSSSSSSNSSLFRTSVHRKVNMEPAPQLAVAAKTRSEEAQRLPNSRLGGGSAREGSGSGRGRRDLSVAETYQRPPPPSNSLDGERKPPTGRSRQPLVKLAAEARREPAEPTRTSFKSIHLATTGAEPATSSKTKRGGSGGQTERLKSELMLSRVSQPETRQRSEVRIEPSRTGPGTSALVPGGASPPHLIPRGATVKIVTGPGDNDVVMLSPGGASPERLVQTAAGRAVYRHYERSETRHFESSTQVRQGGNLVQVSSQKVSSGDKMEVHGFSAGGSPLAREYLSRQGLAAATSGELEPAAAAPSQAQLPGGATSTSQLVRSRSGSGGLLVEGGGRPSEFRMAEVGRMEMKRQAHLQQEFSNRLMSQTGEVVTSNSGKMSQAFSAEQAHQVNRQGAYTVTGRTSMTRNLSTPPGLTSPSLQPRTTQKHFLENGEIVSKDGRLNLFVRGPGTAVEAPPIPRRDSSHARMKHHRGPKVVTTSLGVRTLAAESGSVDGVSSSASSGSLNSYVGSIHSTSDAMPPPLPQKAYTTTMVRMQPHKIHSHAALPPGHMTAMAVPASAAAVPLPLPNPTAASERKVVSSTTVTLRNPTTLSLSDDDQGTRLVRRTSYLMATASENNEKRPEQNSIAVDSREVESHHRNNKSSTDSSPTEMMKTPVQHKRNPSIKKLKSFFGEGTPQIVEATSERKSRQDTSPSAAHLPQVAKEGFLTCKLESRDGKRASDRSWKPSWAVLRGHALYLCRERRDINMLPSPVDDQPISIKAAMVDIAYDYTKKKNVFKLSTFGGSEYLFQAPDENTMLDWISVIQANNNPDSDESGVVSQELIIRKTAQHETLLSNNSHSSKNPLSPGANRKKFSFRGSPSGGAGQNTKKMSTKDKEDISPRDGKKQQNWKGKMVSKIKRIGTGTNLSHELMPGATFGVIIEHCPPSLSNEFVPRIVEICCGVVEEYGLDIVGIYRIPGNTSTINMLQEEANKGLEYCNIEEDDRWQDVNVISSLLKAFFRKLPEPLVPTELYHDFIESNRIQIPSKRMWELKILVHKLPDPHFETIKYLIVHLQKVADNASSNKMEARNLAIVFGPTLIRPADDNMVTMVTDMSDQCCIVESLIVHGNWFFKVDQVDSDVHNDMPVNVTTPDSAPVSNIGLLLSKVKEGEAASKMKKSGLPKSKKPSSSDTESYAEDYGGYREYNIDAAIAAAKQRQQQQAAAGAVTGRQRLLSPADSEGSYKVATAVLRRVEPDDKTPVVAAVTHQESHLSRSQGLHELRRRGQGSQRAPARSPQRSGYRDNQWRQEIAIQRERIEQQHAQAVQDLENDDSGAEEDLGVQAGGGGGLRVRVPLAAARGRELSASDDKALRSPKSDTASITSDYSTMSSTVEGKLHANGVDPAPAPALPGQRLPSRENSREHLLPGESLGVEEDGGDDLVTSMETTFDRRLKALLKPDWKKEEEKDLSRTDSEKSNGTSGSAKAAAVAEEPSRPDGGVSSTLTSHEKGKVSRNQPKDSSASGSSLYGLGGQPYVERRQRDSKHIAKLVEEMRVEREKQGAPAEDKVPAPALAPAERKRSQLEVKLPGSEAAVGAGKGATWRDWKWAEAVKAEHRAVRRRRHTLGAGTNLPDYKTLMAIYGQVEPAPSAGGRPADQQQPQQQPAPEKQAKLSAFDRLKPFGLDSTTVGQPVTLRAWLAEKRLGTSSPDLLSHRTSGGETTTLRLSLLPGPSAQGAMAADLDSHPRRVIIKPQFYNMQYYL